MRIALDATPLTLASGGLRRYVVELTTALGQNFPNDEFWLLSDQKFEAPCPSPANLRTGHGPRNFLDRHWWLWGLRGEMARLGIDVFHGTDFAVPYLPTRPSVMTLHDLSPWMDPAWHIQAARVRRRTPVLLRLGWSSMVVTPSEAIRKQAIEHFRLSPDRVVAVPHAAAPFLRPAPDSQNGTPYFLYVGTLEPRKNLDLLLDVWREVRRSQEIDLVLAGRRRADFPELDPEPGLRLVGLTRDQDLPRLFSGALAFVYPSLYEGFGLPVLEAMQCGAAVIASRDAAISEVAGEAAILLDVADRRSWVEALLGVASNSEQLASLRRKALARSAQFSWDKTAKLTREVYAQAAERFREKA
ncbi:MAG: glycosyltransferase family 1 protein [Bryobacteraceae bacterium]|jgi:glycosyltransferase involved in cell wall biosynthesis